MDKLTLDESTHTYRYDGVIVPSTTQICASLAPRWPVDKYYLIKGTFGHLVTQWEDTGELDESSVDPELEGYLKAYRRFKKETDWHPIDHEIEFYHKKYGYCGRADMRGDFRRSSWFWVIDKKLGQPHESDTLQSPAYLFGLKANGLPVQRCGDLYLRSNGTYRFEEIKSPTEKFIRFVSAIPKWREENNGIGG